METAQTGYYRIRNEVALRSWPRIPHAYYTRDTLHARALTDEEFALLERCDGEHDLPASKLLDDLLRRGLVEPCQRGTSLSSWSQFRAYGNAYVPMVNFMVTGRCNYN